MGLVLKQEYEIFRDISRSLENFLGHLDILFKNFRKDI